MISVLRWIGTLKHAPRPVYQKIYTKKNHQTKHIMKFSKKKICCAILGGRFFINIWGSFIGKKEAIPPAGYLYDRIFTLGASVYVIFFILSPNGVSPSFFGKCIYFQWRKFFLAVINSTILWHLGRNGKLASIPPWKNKIIDTMHAMVGPK